MSMYERIGWRVRTVLVPAAIVLLAGIPANAGAQTFLTRPEGSVSLAQGTSAVLVSPVTFMNRSGMSVRAARDFYNLPNEELLVICDDLNLPLAKLRFRARGSSGGLSG